MALVRREVEHIKHRIYYTLGGYNVHEEPSLLLAPVLRSAARSTLLTSAGNLGGGMILLPLRRTGCRRRLSLLHQAVATGSLGATAVLLRAGADPLTRADRHVIAHGGGYNPLPSALSLAAAEVAELTTWMARLTPSEEDGCLAALTRLALQAAPAKSTAPRALAMLWLLGRAAEALHGAEAVALAMPAAPLAVFRAWPDGVAGLGGAASLGVARTARTLVEEAEAFMATGDEAAAPRHHYLWMRRHARVAACAVLFSVPMMTLIAALPLLAAAAAFVAPFAAFAVACGVVLLAVLGIAAMVQPLTYFAAGLAFNVGARSGVAPVRDACQPCALALCWLQPWLIDERRSGGEVCAHMSTMDLQRTQRRRSGADGSTRGQCARDF
jgi:hypothetical protein